MTEKQDSTNTFNENFLFPHETMRPIQDEMVRLIAKQIEEKNHAVIHAPTGLGKTAASIGPTLKLALDSGKTVFFLTSKNTQHKIAIETVRAIKEKHQKKIIGVNIVGKKWMCIQPAVQLLSTNEFNEYCRALREDKQCVYFENFKKGEGLTHDGKLALSMIEERSPVNVETSIEVGREQNVCPYELALALAKKSNIIVTDYYYLFHPRIRENFLKKNEKELEDCILIVDEGHNLPSRIKDLASENLSSILLKRAISECKKYNHSDLQKVLENILSKFNNLIPSNEDEVYFTKEKLIESVSQIVSYKELFEECYKISDLVLEEQKSSSIGAVGSFFDAWLGKDDGFTRIITRKKGFREDNIQLSYRCLDPSIIAKDVIEKSAATILMSGTLTPTEMYNELLGFPSNTAQITYPSPFPEENRLNLVIAKTSTKFTARSREQYINIANVLTDIINDTPGNTAVFFPSYKIKEEVDVFLTKVEKTVFHERQEMSKQEKDEMIDRFRTYKKTGAALLAVVSGSYGEGIDLPGDELKTVVVVGLPLGRPDLETKALIDYYDKKFKRGWDYGYVFPAFNKIIQNAGRCIRSGTDTGVIVFLDERFTWPRYYRCFPTNWKIKVSVDRYREKIQKFFAEHK